MSLPMGPWRLTYTPGQWIVLAGPKLVAVMQPAPPKMSSLVGQLWTDMQGAGSLDALLELLRGYSLDQMPDFAAFVWEGQALHGLARGRISVVDASTGETALDGEGALTWHEAHFGAVRGLRVEMAPVDHESVLHLPLIVGAVGASALHLTTDPSQLVRFPDTVNQIPEPVAPATPRPSEPLAPMAESAPAPAPAPVEEPASRPQPVEDLYASPAHSPSPVYPSAPEYTPSAPQPSAPEYSTPQYSTPDYSSAPAPDYSSTPAPTYPPASEYAPAPSHTPSPSYPQAPVYSTPYQPPVAPAPVPTAPTPVPPVPAGSAPSMAGLDATEGMEHDDFGFHRSEPPISAIAMGIQTNTGEFQNLMTGLVIGRAPDASRGPAGVGTMRVPSPGNDISRSHVLVQPEGRQARITDLDSTNGTTIQLADDEPFLLEDGQSVLVPIGTVLNLGDGVSLRIEPAR